VVHDEPRHRFVAIVGGLECTLAYRIVDATTVDFTSTYTPAELRGRGLAKIVVREALAWARGGGRKVIPSCWYVREYLEKEAK
jgi:hypothetical protein